MKWKNRVATIKNQKPPKIALVVFEIEDFLLSIRIFNQV